MHLGLQCVFVRDEAPVGWLFSLRKFSLRKAHSIQLLTAQIGMSTRSHRTLRIPRIVRNESCLRNVSQSNRKKDRYCLRLSLLTNALPLVQTTKGCFAIWSNEYFVTVLGTVKVQRVRPSWARRPTRRSNKTAAPQSHRMEKAKGCHALTQWRFASQESSRPPLVD